MYSIDSFIGDLYRFICVCRDSFRSDFEASHIFTTIFSFIGVLILSYVFCYSFEGVRWRYVFCYSFEGVRWLTLYVFLDPKGTGVLKLPGSASDSNVFIVGTLLNRTCFTFNGFPIWLSKQNVYDYWILTLRICALFPVVLIYLLRCLNNFVSWLLRQTLKTHESISFLLLYTRLMNLHRDLNF